MRSKAKGDCRHSESRDFAQRSPGPCPCFQPSCSPGIRASQAPGKLQVLIPGLVPRINNEGTSHSRGSPETTTHHKGQEEAEVLARAEGGLGHVGRAGSGLGHMGKCPAELLSVKRGRVPSPQSRLP